MLGGYECGGRKVEHLAADGTGDRRPGEITSTSAAALWAVGDDHIWIGHLGEVLPR
jgi:hypothetical protein